MSDLHINIRFMYWHFQLSRDWKPGITRNMWHKANGYPDGKFSVYQFFWYFG